MTLDSRKPLIVFYSFEGNCRTLAGVMAEAAGAETAELVPEKEITRSFALKYFSGGTVSLFRQTTPLRPLPVTMQDFGLIIIGTPVWAWSMTPAVRTFLQGQNWQGRQTALFAMHRGTSGFALPAMRKIITAGGGSVLGEASFFDLRWRGAAQTRETAAAWAAEMAEKHQQAQTNQSG